MIIYVFCTLLYLFGSGKMVFIFIKFVNSIGYCLVNETNELSE